MNDFVPLYLITMILGLLIIIQGLYWLKTGKSRDHLWGFHHITKEENPEDYWMNVRLSIGIGLIVFVISAILIVLVWVQT